MIFWAPPSVMSHFLGSTLCSKVYICSIVNIIIIIILIAVSPPSSPPSPSPPTSPLPPSSTPPRLCFYSENSRLPKHGISSFSKIRNLPAIEGSLTTKLLNVLFHKPVRRTLRIFKESLFDRLQPRSSCSFLVNIWKGVGLSHCCIWSRAF